MTFLISNRSLSKLYQEKIFTLHLRNLKMNLLRSFSTCKSVILPRFGPPEVLELKTNSEIPKVGMNEALVRVKAVSINPLDLKMREGYGKSIFSSFLPLILGRDVSGEVVELGSTWKRHVSVGDDVFGALAPTAIRGTYSEFAVLEISQLAKKPPSLSHEEASAIPFASLTAWRALFGNAKIKKGQRLLVIGGGGAVGMAAIQLAVAIGCHVATTCGNSTLSLAKELGASPAVHFASPSVREELGGHFDAVLDTIGVPETEAMAVDVLRKGGSYMTLQGEWVKNADMYGVLPGGTIAASLLLKTQMQYQQSHGIKYYWTVMRNDPEGFYFISNLTLRNKFKIPISKILPFENAAEGHRLKEKNEINGKIVLTMN